MASAAGIAPASVHTNPEDFLVPLAGISETNPEDFLVTLAGISETQGDFVDGSIDDHSQGTQDEAIQAAKVTRRSFNAS